MHRLPDKLLRRTDVLITYGTPEASQMERVCSNSFMPSSGMADWVEVFHAMHENCSQGELAQMKSKSEQKIFIMASTSHFSKSHMEESLADQLSRCPRTANLCRKHCPHTPRK